MRSPLFYHIMQVLKYISGSLKGSLKPIYSIFIKQATIIKKDHVQFREENPLISDFLNH